MNNNERLIVNYEVVGKDGNCIDIFEQENIAIEYAKKNNYKTIIQGSYILDNLDNIIKEDHKIIWKNQEEK